MESPLEQSDMFPDLIPDIVVRIWKAHQRHYRTGTHDWPKREELVRYLEADPGKPASAATIDRARKMYPRLLTPWPIKRGQRPPWLTDPELRAEYQSPARPVDAQPLELHGLDRDHIRLEAFDEHGQRQTMEVVVDERGVLRLVARWRDASAVLVASLVVFAVLDVMSDGRLDGVIHWCHVLIKSTRLVA